VLALLLNVPKSLEDWARFSFHHRQSHELIVKAIAKQKSIDLPVYIVDPISFQEPRLFLEANQQFHQDMDNALGVQSTDLEDVNLQDERQLQSWIYLHWQEHVTAENALGISS
jgi:hypothetical protein